MSTQTLGWLVGARDCKKLGSGWDPVNSIPTLSQLGPSQTFVPVLYPKRKNTEIFMKVMVIIKTTIRRKEVIFLAGKWPPLCQLF